MEQNLPLRFFNPREAGTFSAVARCMLALDENESENDVAAYVDAFLASKDNATQKTFHLLLFMFERLPVFLFFKPFSRLSRGAQEKYIRMWENAPVKKLRAGYFGLKTLALLGFYTDEKWWKDIGYEGPLLTQK